jgi:predicted Zn-ribbon and HTH transcriptional regulator
MDNEKYVCKKCGWEWTAIPGAESAPECPECESRDIETLEKGTVGFAVTAPDKKA